MALSAAARGRAVILARLVPARVRWRYSAVLVGDPLKGQPLAVTFRSGVRCGLVAGSRMEPAPGPRREVYPGEGDAGLGRVAVRVGLSRDSVLRRLGGARWWPAR